MQAPYDLPTTSSAQAAFTDEDKTLIVARAIQSIIPIALLIAYLSKKRKWSIPWALLTGFTTWVPTAIAIWAHRWYQIKHPPNS